jgi:hypothetical protein
MTPAFLRAIRWRSSVPDLSLLSFHRRGGFHLIRSLTAKVNMSCYYFDRAVPVSALQGLENVHAISGDTCVPGTMVTRMAQVTYGNMLFGSTRITTIAHVKNQDSMMSYDITLFNTITLAILDTIFYLFVLTCSSINFYLLVLTSSVINLLKLSINLLFV